MKIFAIAVIVAIALVSLPSDVVGDLAPVQDAEAAPCIWGWDDACIIPASECFQPRRPWCN